MNINRHNYEEFFLLYVDNELSAADRKAVDVFVKENPDLLIELQLLQQTIVQADDVVLDKKDWLFMEEGITALQENLLLYADDELNPSDKRSVEALLATDRSVQAEWNILRQTKLQPDNTVVFEDKNSLYRTEGGRVVGFGWRRIAAAAVLLGVGLWTGISVYKNNLKTITRSKEIEIARGTQSKATQPASQLPVNTITTKNQTNENPAATNETALLKSKDQSGENKKQQAEKVIKQNKNEVNDNNIAVQNSNNKKPGNNLPNPYSENINNKESNLQALTSVSPERNKNNINGAGTNNGIVKPDPKDKITNSVIAGINKSNDDPTTTAAIPVVYNNTTDENSNDRILYMDEEKVKRTMLGGLIRKAKRVLERTTNIKTGDGIKVAGFEIALK